MTYNVCSCVALIIFWQSVCVAQKDLVQAPIPKREVRAVWIATVSGLDWPPNQDSSDQKQSLREMIRKLHVAHFNTIFFQVRGRGDAMYRSHFEPWSHLLSGTLGENPGWDPLAMVIEEAHARGKIGRAHV